MTDFLDLSGESPVLSNNEDVQNLLLSSMEANDKIIALTDYVGNLCDWGDNINKLTEAQKNFYLNQLFEMEVNNGGLSQYFFNTGQYAHETVSSLKEIGAQKTEEILQRAINKFPKAIVPKDDELWDELEDEFYEYGDNLNELNLAYIQQNIDQF